MPHCAICQSTDGVRTYTFAIDGEPLRAMKDAPLCAEHGERLIMRLGYILGSLDKPIGRVFTDFAPRAPLSDVSDDPSE